MYVFFLFASWQLFLWLNKFIQNKFFISITIHRFFSVMKHVLYCLKRRKTLQTTTRKTWGNLFNSRVAIHIHFHTLSNKLYILSQPINISRFKSWDFAGQFIVILTFLSIPVPETYIVDMEHTSWWNEQTRNFCSNRVTCRERQTV